MTTDTFAITPPSQEDVETHASLEGYKVTPSARYKATLGTAERQENDSQTWVAVGLPVTLLSTVEGAEEVGGGLGFGNLATHEVYVPSDDMWVTDTDYPVSTGGSEFAVGMVTHGSNIHVIGSGAFGLSGDRHFKYTCP